MCKNIRNFGIAEGRLTRDPKVFINSDGSRKVKFTLAVQDNYTDKNGVRGAQFISFDGFIPRRQIELQQKNGKPENGVYALIHKGDLVGVEYSIRTSNFVDKTTGEIVFSNSLLVQNIDFKESKSVTTARLSESQTEYAGYGNSYR